MVPAKASIIIPTHNGDQYIGQTVDSALAQTYGDVEVIVVDDGSTDDTRQVLAQYGSQICYIHQENRGPAAARNVGFAAAQGEYLLFLDSDDLIPPDKLTRQINFLEAHPNYQIVYSAWQFISSDGARIIGEVRPGKEGNLLKDILCRSFVIVSPGAVVLRRECLEKGGLFDESLALMGSEDTDLWLRLATAGYTFGYINQPLLQYRVRRGSMSSRITRQIYSRSARLDKYFANPNLPEEIKKLKAETYSIFQFEIAANYFRINNPAQGRAHLQQAIKECPVLAQNINWILEWLAASVLEPQTTDAIKMINLFFDNLPPEAIHLKPLRRQAIGRYHLVATFLAYQSQNFTELKKHIWPALRANPSVLKNRGFLSISLRALFA